MTNPIRILIVDDHKIVRKGLRAILTTEPGLEVVGEAAGGNEAITQALHLRPDVILLDLIMPDKDGVTALREIRKENSQARALVLTSLADDEKIFKAIQAGAGGYLLKDASPKTLFQAIRTVNLGKPYLPAHVTLRLIDGIKQPSDAEVTLSEREIDVIRLVAQGLSNQDIAKALDIAPGTVSVHISAILKKLQLENRVQATLYALRKGWVKLDHK